MLRQLGAVAQAATGGRDKGSNREGVVRSGSVGADELGQVGLTFRRQFYAQLADFATFYRSGDVAALDFENVLVTVGFPGDSGDGFKVTLIGTQHVAVEDFGNGSGMGNV
ncbi:hypothetical protein PUP75_12335 [Pseudomonas chlororaphis]|uniref:hypothetical protein n=1 Tax=Pseudomonas chlororaphis TaxID=587753 RepID=UPI002368CC31|nr:hypothetical protein [Pseudomonas chlororaphis]WDH55537.1 hypothetical protein PUP75_12335 [Pseudomonas chlororaphis]